MKNSEGAWIADPVEIQNVVISAFKSQLNGVHMPDYQNILEVIPHLITKAQNVMLTKFLSPKNCMKLSKL